MLGNHTIKRILAILGILLLVSCSGPDAKKMKFFTKGKALYEKGELVKAKLEFKNALQIDPKFADVYRMMGMVSLKEGNIKAAYGNFSKAVELDPANRDAQFQLGKILLGVRETDKAMEKAELLLRQDPKNVDALQLKGAVMVAGKEFDKARQYLEGLIGQGIRTPDVFLLLATAEGGSGDAKGSERAVRRGIEANPKSVPLNLALAEICARDKRIDEAAAILKKVSEIEPANAGHKLNLAGLYWAFGREREGVDVLNQLIAVDPASEEHRKQAHNRLADAERELKEGIAKNSKGFSLRFALSELYLNTNRVDQGIATLKECLGLESSDNPGVIQAKNALARIFLSRNELDQAGRYADEVIKESTQNVEAHFTKGNIYLLKKEGGKAVAEFGTVVSENPQFLQGYVRLAEAHLINKEMNLVLDNLKNAQKIDPNSREVQIAFARYYAIQKDFKSGEDVLANILEKNPSDLEARVQLGDFFIAAGDEKRAETEYGEVKRKAPNVPIGYVKMGELYIREKKTERAIGEFEQAFKVNPQSWRVANDLAFLLGDTAKSARDLDRALNLAEKARALNPAELTVQDTLGWLNYRKGNTAKAVELLSRVQAKAPEASVVNYHLGMALYKAGRLPDAKQSLSKALARKDEFAGRDEAARTLAKI